MPSDEFESHEFESRESAQERELDQLLSHGLRALKAPAGFTARVMEQLPQAQSSGPMLHLPQRQMAWRRLRPMLWRRPVAGWTTAAVVAATVFGGGYLGYQHQQRIAGEQARQELLLALRITDTTLQSVRDKIIEDHAGNEEP